MGVNPGKLRIVGKLTVKTRDKFGKGASRKHRAEGLVPGICYGHNLESPVPVLINPDELRDSLDPIKKINTVIEVTVEGAKATKINVMIREPQIHAISQQLEHVDLVAIDIDKDVEVDVPVVLTGKSIGVIEGGILNVILRSVTVRCKPVNIPVEFTLDVTDIDVLGPTRPELRRVAAVREVPAGLKVLRQDRRDQQQSRGARECQTEAHVASWIRGGEFRGIARARRVRTHRLHPSSS